MDFKNNEFNNFADALEECLYMLDLQKKILWKEVIILNTDLQVVFQGMITEGNVNENIKLIVNGYKYYVEEE